MDIRAIITKEDLGQPYNSLHEFDLNEIFEVEKALQGRQIKFSKYINLNYEFKELIESIGIEKVKKIATVFYGESIYFPKIKETCKEKIKKKIIDEFNGHNYAELSQKYEYSERYIRNVVKFKVSNSKILDNQLDIFDYLDNKKV